MGYAYVYLQVVDENGQPYGDWKYKAWSYWRYSGKNVDFPVNEWVNGRATRRFTVSVPENCQNFKDFRFVVQATINGKVQMVASQTLPTVCGSPTLSVTVPRSTGLVTGGIAPKPEITGMTSYTPTQEAHVSNVQNYIDSTLSNIAYEIPLVAAQPTGSQVYQPPVNPNPTPASNITGAEQAARPLPTNGQILGGISTGTAIGAGLLAWWILRRKR